MRITTHLTFLVLLGVSCAQQQVSAAMVTYTDAASFYAALAGGSYTEQFEGQALGVASSPLTFTGNGYTFTAQNTNNIVADTKFNVLNDNTTGHYLHANSAWSYVDFDFAQNSGIYAAGGYFWVSDSSGTMKAGALTLWVNNVKVYDNVTDGTNRVFRGVVSTAPLNYFEVQTSSGPPGSGNSNYYNVDSFTVGTAQTPEPAALSLVAAGIGALALRLRRTSSR